MNAYPKPRPGVLDIEAYVPGKSTAPGVAKVFKLSSNETPLGPSPRAVAAYKTVGAHLADYPDGAASDKALARASQEKSQGGTTPLELNRLAKEVPPNRVKAGAFP